ncbi:MAG TPA: preprotein translocase subunit SecG [Burkholderiales bacterium]|jgi:preprotein translocase subunit SecG|nr:preprotein translocase subunit SecG [Burkholderiales bacterium]
METLVLVLHVLTALAICGLVLLQHGKGADVGAAFGGGASGSIFGSTGSANFLSRATAILAAIFFLSSMGLTYFSGRKTEHKGVMATQPAPAKPGPVQVPVPGSPAGKPSITVGEPLPEAQRFSEPPTGPEERSKAKDVPK